MQCEPRFNRVRQNTRRCAVKVIGVFPRYLAKHRNIPRDDRQLVLGGLDEGQSKAFSVGGGDQAGAGSVDFFQVFVADAFEPEQALIQFGVRAKTVDEGLYHPSLFANDDEVEVNAGLPELLEGI